jgi:CRP-like cAMP-binding protein
MFSGRIALERNNYQVIVLSAPLLLSKAMIEEDNLALYTARTISDVEIWRVRTEDVEKTMQCDPALSYKIYTYSTALMVRWIVERRNRIKALSEDVVRSPSSRGKEGTISLSSGVSDSATPEEVCC